MNAARQKWIELLRSGDYEQAKSTLHINASNQYCCLGIACEAYRQEHQGRWDGDRAGTFVFGTSSGEATSGYILNTPIAAWLELGKREEQEYVRMNEEGQSFKAIAAAIEART